MYVEIDFTRKDVKGMFSLSHPSIFKVFVYISVFLNLKVSKIKWAIPPLRIGVFLS